MTVKKSAVTIYHNPRCSKSRATLDLIHDHGAEPQVIEYLQNPPSAAELERLLTLLDLEPRDLMRRKEDLYKELGLDDPKLDRKTLIAAMVAHPRLIERPIVVTGNGAALGRPPENVLPLLGGDANEGEPKAGAQ